MQNLTELLNSILYSVANLEKRNSTIKPEQIYPEEIELEFKENEKTIKMLKEQIVEILESLNQKSYENERFIVTNSSSTTQSIKAKSILELKKDLALYDKIKNYITDTKTTKATIKYKNIGE